MIDIVMLALFSLLGAMSPGPDFAIVARYALTGCRKTALIASLGISCAILVHVTYCSLGVAVILRESPTLFRLIQIIGSCYLGYLGIKLLLSSTSQSKKPVAKKKAFLNGFLTNVLNPKATMFILSLYTQFSDSTTPTPYLFLYGLVIFLITALWFFSLSFLMTHKGFAPHFIRFQKYLMKTMGVFLLILALTVLF